MKYIFSVIVLLYCPYSLALFHCWRKAEEHVKLKEQSSLADSFLTEGMNKPESFTLSLRKPESNSTITRSIPHYLFKKSAEWQLEIVNDQNNCLAINDLVITSPQESRKNSLHLYTWDLLPKRSGIALVRATYTAPYRKDQPHIQEFLVTVE